MALPSNVALSVGLQQTNTEYYQSLLSVMAILNVEFLDLIENLNKSVFLKTDLSNRKNFYLLNQTIKKSILESGKVKKNTNNRQETRQHKNICNRSIYRYKNIRKYIFFELLQYLHNHTRAVAVALHYTLWE